MEDTKANIMVIVEPQYENSETICKAFLDPAIFGQLKPYNSDCFYTTPSSQEGEQLDQFISKTLSTRFATLHSMIFTIGSTKLFECVQKQSKQNQLKANLYNVVAHYQKNSLDSMIKEAIIHRSSLIENEETALS